MGDGCADKLARTPGMLPNHALKIKNFYLQITWSASRLVLESKKYNRTHNFKFETVVCNVFEKYLCSKIRIVCASRCSLMLTRVKAKFSTELFWLSSHFIHQRNCKMLIDNEFPCLLRARICCWDVVSYFLLTMSATK